MSNVIRVTNADVEAAYEARKAAKSAYSKALAKLDSVEYELECEGITRYQASKDFRHVAANNACEVAHIAYLEYDAVYKAMDYVHDEQCTNAIKRGVYTCAEFLVGLNVNDPKTHNVIVDIVRAAFEDSNLDVEVSALARSVYISVPVEGIQHSVNLTAVNARTHEIGDVSVIREHMQVTPGVSELTRDDVEVLAIERVRALDRLESLARAYRENVGEILDKYRCIGDVLDMEYAARPF